MLIPDDSTPDYLNLKLPYRSLTLKHVHQKSLLKNPLLSQGDFVEAGVGTGVTSSWLWTDNVEESQQTRYSRRSPHSFSLR